MPIGVVDHQAFLASSSAGIAASACSGSIISLVSVSVMLAVGALRVMTTVRSSGASTEAIAPRRAAKTEPVLSFLARSMVNFTSSAVKGSPSCHLASASLKV